MSFMVAMPMSGMPRRDIVVPAPVYAILISLDSWIYLECEENDIYEITRGRTDTEKPD
jgi:hypothetical protein